MQPRAAWFYADSRKQPHPFTLWHIWGFGCYIVGSKTDDLYRPLFNMQAIGRVKRIPAKCEYLDRFWFLLTFLISNSSIIATAHTPKSPLTSLGFNPSGVNPTCSQVVHMNTTACRPGWFHLVASSVERTGPTTTSKPNRVSFQATPE